MRRSPVAGATVGARQAFRALSLAMRFARSHCSHWPHWPHWPGAMAPARADAEAISSPTRVSNKVASVCVNVKYLFVYTCVFIEKFLAGVPAPRRRNCFVTGKQEAGGGQVGEKDARQTCPPPWHCERWPGGRSMSVVYSAGLIVGAWDGFSHAPTINPIAVMASGVPCPIGDGRRRGSARARGRGCSSRYARRA